MDRYDLCLRVTACVVSVCLFIFGFIMAKLPFEYSDHYNTGQQLSSVSQGLAIMVFTVAACVDNVYALRCVHDNFGFLSHLCGRGLFYLLIGFYALPLHSMLDDLSE